MTENINYRELLDIILQILYKLKFRQNKAYHSLRDIVEGLKYPLDITDIYEAGKYLEAQGFIRPEFEFGDVFAEITSAGMLYVEEKLPKNGKTDKLLQHIDNISQYDEELIPEFRKPLLNQIDEMKDILKKNRRGKSDVGKDLDILKIEIEKINPDMDVIETKLDSIEKERMLKRYAHKIRNIMFI